MDNYYIRKVLSDSELQKIKEILDAANKENKWNDGKLSAGGNKLKSNLELNDVQLSSTLNSIIMPHIDEDKIFSNFTVPSRSSYNFTSKMEAGGKYGLHLDVELSLIHI